MSLEIQCFMVFPMIVGSRLSDPWTGGQDEKDQVLLTIKQAKRVNRAFFGKLNELSENCELGSQEVTLLRDQLIAKSRIQKSNRNFWKKLEHDQAFEIGY